MSLETAKKKSLIFMWIAVLSSILFAPATGTAKPSAKKIKKEITEKVTAYAEAIGCANQKDLKIIGLAPYDGKNRLDAKYLVLWKGDIGCAGGSGTDLTHAALVRIGAGETFFVDVKKSSPNIKFESPVRYVDKVRRHSTDSVTLVGKGLDEGDAQCCPSLTVTFTLKMDSKGNWKLRNKQVRGKSKKNQVTF